MKRHSIPRFFFTVVAIAFLCVAAMPFAHADSCALRTHTQVEWGTSSKGDNAASYRTKHFLSAFPDGATIGVGGIASARFTASSKVQLFLPAVGVSGALTGNLVDPTNTTAGALAGEGLAMTLNIGFDNDNASFAPAALPLANATVTTGECGGMTVGALLAQANLALGGAATALAPAQLSACLALVNGNASVLSCAVPAAAPLANATIPEVPAPAPYENSTQNASANATQPPGPEPVPLPVWSLRVAPWYPKVKSDGTHYVFLCDTNGARPTRYDWRFGDGEKLLGIHNGDVYHIFKRAGTYAVTCGAANTTQLASMTVTVG